MKIEGFIKEELQQGVNDLIMVDFPWCKEQIIRTRALIGIEDAEIWMKYRNAIDRLLSIQHGINLGEFPSPKFAFGQIDTEKMDGIVINPHEVLSYSAYLFRNCGVEAWVQTTEALIGLLSMRINSFSYGGDKIKANIKLKEALEQQANGRMSRSDSHLTALFFYKKSSEKAIEGLELLNRVNPYTSGSFFIVIILLIIFIFILIQVYQQLL